MRTLLKICVLLIVTYECKGGLIDGLLTGIHDAHTKIHEAAGAVIGGITGQVPKETQGKPADTTVVVVINEENAERGPNYGQGSNQFSNNRPNPYGNGFKPNHYGHGHHHHHHQPPPYDQNGVNSPNYGGNPQNGNNQPDFGNYKPNHGGQPNFGSNQPNDKPNYGYNQPGYGNNGPSYGNNQPSYGNNGPNYGNNRPSYGNNGPSYGNNRPSYGNQPNYGDGQPNYNNNQPNDDNLNFGNNKPNYGNNDQNSNGPNYGNNRPNPGNNGPSYGNNQQNYENQSNNNGDGQLNYGNNQPNDDNLNFGNNQPIHGNNEPNTNHNNNFDRPTDTQGGQHQDHTTEYVSKLPLKPSSNYDSKPNYEDNTTKRPQDDGPLFVPLDPNVNNYAENPNEGKEPKRETNENMAKPDDDDEDLGLDVRFGQ